VSEQRSQEAAEPIFVGLVPSQVADRDDGALRRGHSDSVLTSQLDDVALGQSLVFSLEINHHIPEAKGS
jgi:hypothetical protein